MRAMFRALLLSTVVMFAGASYAGAASDSDCFPALAEAAPMTILADAMQLASAQEIILRGTIGPVADQGQAQAELSSVVAAADVVIPLPDDLGSEVAQTLAAWSAPVADAETAAEANLAVTTEEAEATGSLVTTAVAIEESGESSPISAPTVE
jgi:hypothetical protein